MPSLLLTLLVASLVSIVSFLTVLFRISPLLTPYQAIPAFLVSLFLASSSTGTLLLSLLWKALPVHTWDEGRILSISLRQGLLLASAISIVALFQILQLLTWWSAILIVIVFLLIELALHAE
ncbi:hypothetical protein HYZ98_01305 [Candidatus Peregrinibacteria bacterium]|nr:hypothetical protein [Candidatus Peregrinibacteria bacterium]